MFQIGEGGPFGRRSDEACENKRAEDTIVIKLCLSHALAVLKERINLQLMVEERKGSIAEVTPVICP